MTAEERKTRRESQLLRGVAAILIADPVVPFRSLAEQAGVSRRTLYRLASSREDLLRRLQQAANDATRQTLARARIADVPFMDALRALTEDFLADSDLYGFWSPSSWAASPRILIETEADQATRDYRQAMERYFERGREAGLLRSDLPAAWMILVYDALLLAAAGELRAGRGACAMLAERIIQSLLHGLASRPASATPSDEAS